MSAQFSRVLTWCAPRLDYGSQWAALVVDASALDRQHEILFATVVDASNKNVMLAMDIPGQRLTPLPAAFVANNTGPYCFDASLGMLVSAGSPLGGLVGLEVRLGCVAHV